MSLEYQDSYKDWKKLHPDPVALQKPKPKPTTKAMTKKIVEPPKKKKQPWEWKSTDTHGYKTRKEWRMSMKRLGGTDRGSASGGGYGASYGGGLW